MKTLKSQKEREELKLAPVKAFHDEPIEDGPRRSTPHEIVAEDRFELGYQQPLDNGRRE